MSVSYDRRHDRYQAKYTVARTSESGLSRLEIHISYHKTREEARQTLNEWKADPRNRRYLPAKDWRSLSFTFTERRRDQSGRFTRGAV